MLAVSGCAASDALFADEPTLAPGAPSRSSLQALPPPVKRLYVAVYSFRDQTGQNKPNDSFPEYSRALTQGGAAILVNALKEAGGGRWFIVLERENLDALLQERQLIRANREQFLGEDGKPLPPLRGLYNAALIIGGGIVGFDSNVMTGGLGARYLGIGARTEYRRDQVTVYLRMTAVTTGEVLASVVATKTIYSVAVAADVFRFFSSDKLLESEGGLTRNEPRELAVRQAIEKAVHALVLEGATLGFFEFADAEAARPLLDAYRAEKARAQLLDLSSEGRPSELNSQQAAAPRLWRPPIKRANGLALRR